MRSVRAQFVKYLRKVVLHCPAGVPPTIRALVEDLMSDGVMYVRVVGAECVRIEDLIDEWVPEIGRGKRMLLTASRPNETVGEAVRQASLPDMAFAGEGVQVIEL